MTKREDPSFLVMTDRDGTIIKDVPYLSRLSDIEFLPGVVDTIRKLNILKVPVCVVTNQSGVARGYFSEEFVQESHLYMNELLGREGATIDRFFYCPHLAQTNDPRYNRECLCRKPHPGLLLSALETFPTPLSRAMMVGDAVRDVEAAKASGVKGYLILGNSDIPTSSLPEKDYVGVLSFQEAVNRFLGESGITLS